MAPALRSMTGFGSGSATLDRARLQLDMRAVNHRHLEVRVRTPREAPDVGPLVEALVREHFARGRFDVTVQLTTGGPGATHIDPERVRALYKELRALQEELAPGSPLPFDAVLRLPEGIRVAPTGDATALESALRKAFAEAKEEFDKSRTLEGQHLTRDILGRLGRIRECVARAKELTPAVVERRRERLRLRIRELGEAQVDPTRLEQELALFADRSDVSEELTRLDAHVRHFEATLATAADHPVGKKLEFLLQELAREATTLSAKANDAELSHITVDIKAEVERIREQTMNVE
jgi:uncharacterized protein (TIGR00255 family)